MSSNPIITAHDLPCPNCGYDLRGTVPSDGERRCPECGQIWRGATPSQIPWVYRSLRGRVRAYMQTTWMVLLRPGVLARETIGPVRRRDALRFHQISLALTTLLATIAFATVFALTSYFPRMEPDWLKPETFWMTPTSALADSWWALLPLALGSYLTAAWLLGLYRFILRCGYGPGMPGDRLWRVGLYASALAPLETLLLGVAYVALIYAGQEDPWPLRWHAWIVGTLVLATLTALIIFLVPSLILVWKSGNHKIGRTFLLTLLPFAAILMLLCLLAICLWLTGFVAMAFCSLTR